jgi:Flp pilus assembly protein CpaB
VSVPLLQNLLVLAVGKDVGTELQIPGEDERAPSWRQRLTTVTVAVTPKQAKQLALAQDQGILQFALRNSDDVEVIDGLVETTRQDLLDPLRRKAVQDSKRDRVRSVGATKGLTQLD